MAAKKQNNRRGTAKTTSKKKNTRKRTAKDQGVASGFQTEIILWIFFAASIILIISNLGMGGTVGGSISQASFGIMGLLAYLFPVLLFGCAVFFISNRKNPEYQSCQKLLVCKRILSVGYKKHCTSKKQHREKIGQKPHDPE